MPIATFVPGEEVIFLRRYDDWIDRHSWRWGKVAKVKKVHKTGRFTIEGDTVANRTFRPCFFDTRPDGWCSDPFGDETAGHDRVYKLTDKLKARIAIEKVKQELESRAIRAQRTVYALRPEFLTEEQVTLLERIIELSKSKTAE